MQYKIGRIRMNKISSKSIMSATGAACLLLAAGTQALGGSPSASQVWYVDLLAGGGEDGMSWNGAFTDLQDALGSAVAGDEIWVAGGQYTPTADGQRSVSFQLPSGVGVYGGFVGFESQRAQRNSTNALTVLSGDLNGDDLPGFVNVGENSYHVVVCNGGSNSTVLDGFTIRGGNANGSGSDVNGAGLSNTNTTMTVSACRFEGNLATGSGAGISNVDSDPSIFGCAFTENQSSGGGAAMWNNASSPVIVNSLFARNAHIGGGGESGGIYIGVGSGPLIINCTFTENTANQANGGAIFIHPWNTPALPTRIYNSIFWNNSDTNGGDTDIGTGGTFAGAVVQFTIIQQGFVGAGNSSADPQFADAGAGDYRPAPGSPAIDSADSGSYQGPLFDIAQVNRFLDDPASPNTGSGTPLYLDRGAYEFGVQPCQADLAPPFGVLDFSDVIAFLTAFSSQDPIADLAPPTGVFDFSDVVEYLIAFGAGCP